MTRSQAHEEATTASPPVLASFAAIEGGEFTMGSDEPAAGEGPAGTVFVSPFWCCRTATSNDEFAAFVEATGYRTTAERRRDEATWRTFATSERAAHPVVMVSWEDATAYAEWLCSTSERTFRLPTEAEWEKAARGGLVGATYPWGDSAPEEVGANFGAMGRTAMPRTVAVTEIPRNGYGLHIGGNVWEWVHDWYDPSAYSSMLRRNPCGPATGVERCRRGGAYNNRRGFRLRVSSRNRLRPDATFRNMGFRLVCEADPAITVARACSSHLAVRPTLRVLSSHPAVLPTSRILPSHAADDHAWDAALRAALDGCTGLRTRVEAVLDVLRPSLEEDRGGVRVVRADNDVVELELIGTCHGCPKSDMTYVDIRETLLRHVPELHHVARVVRC